jgi:hypothetical protein
VADSGGFVYKKFTILPYKKPRIRIRNNNSGTLPVLEWNNLYEPGDLTPLLSNLLLWKPLGEVGQAQEQEMWHFA